MSIRALLCAVLTVVMSRRAAGSQSWSNITLATCDQNDAAQIYLLDSQRGFVVSVDSGRIIDIYTGRCLTVWECTDTENAVITADTCGGGCASSKPEGQTWEIHSSGSLLIKSSVSEGVRCIDASKSHSEGEPPVVAHTCGLGTNQDWTLDTSGSGLLKVGAGDYSPPCKAPPCCLKVDCGEVVPLSLGSCVPVGRAAWIFVLVFFIGGSLYVAGGVVHAVKVQGRDLDEGLALLPHQTFWKEVRGLVEDGVRFAYAEVERRREGQVPQANTTPIVCKHTEFGYTAVPDVAKTQAQQDVDVTKKEHSIAVDTNQEQITGARATAESGPSGPNDESGSDNDSLVE